MSTYDVRVFEVPCDASGRLLGRPKARPRQRVRARGIDAAKKAAKAQVKGRIISANVTGSRSLAIYVEKS